MAEFIKRHRLFIFIVIPLGVLLTMYAADLVEFLNVAGLDNFTTGDLGIYYLIFSILLLSIEGRINRKSDKVERLGKE